MPGSLNRRINAIGANSLATRLAIAQGRLIPGKGATDCLIKLN